MEFDESKRRPPSTRDLLYNQVKENSDMCDVTIKLGHWEKRFHWCVLVASPYFENIRRHGYLERETGVISMNIGTPVTLEKGILYLYGKPPKITTKNVASLLEIAEYLIMPGLKAECVKSIKECRITDDNCLVMIALSSIYDFNLPSYEEYVMGHIPDLIQTDAMMDLAEESVEYILTDPDLGYVKTTDKFLFLVHWIRRRTDRKLKFLKLFKLIDFEDVERSFITEIVMHEPLINELENATEIISALESTRCLKTCDVLLCPDKYTYNKRLPCFDLTRLRWSSINIEHEYPDGFEERMVSDIGGVWKKDSAIVYMLSQCYSQGKRQDVIYILDLETKDVKKSTVSDTCTIVERDLRNKKTYIHNNEIILVANEIIHDRRHEDVEVRSPIDQDLFNICLRHGIGSLEGMLASVALTNHLTQRGRKRISTATLYVGEIKDETTYITPILSLRTEISHACANGPVIAMLSQEFGLFIFNREDHSIECISLIDKEVKIDQQFKLVAVGSGFVIYNQLLFINVARKLGPNLPHNYLVQKYNFPENEHISHWTEYHYCENRWYLFSKDVDGRPVFEHTTHEKLVSLADDLIKNPAGHRTDIWEALPSCERLGSTIFQITLPKDRLSCSVTCPHCKQQREAERRTRTFYVSDDSSDDSDDYGLYEDYFLYDSDSYYYYSSD